MTAKTLFLITTLTLGLSACGEQSKESDLTASSQTSESEQIGTNGQLISIQSDNVRAAGYDSISMIMTVQFDNGYLYEYYGVPAELWASFIAAQPYPWSQVGYPRLVQGGIPYKRIG
jgi:ABC-type uncharacterized transport system auxiliary subunit